MSADADQLFLWALEEKLKTDQTFRRLVELLVKGPLPPAAVKIIQKHAA